MTRPGGGQRLFVAMGPDWGRHPSTLGHIMRLVAETEPVVWINSIAQRTPRLTLRDLRRGAEKVLAALHPRAASTGGPIVLHPRVLPYHQYATVRRLNGRLLEGQLRPLIAQLRPRSVTLVTTNPAAVGLVDYLKPDVTCYFCMDDYAQMGDSDAELIEVCERLLLAQADIVFGTSLALCRSKSNGRRPTVYLPQGVDAAHFDRESLPGAPVEIASLPRPIIGFQGIVGGRVDLGLLEQVARAFPSASVVTVGKVEANLQPLLRLPNFRAFGAVPYAQLPRWIQAFDIGLIAYAKDGHTASINPLKLLEYLALGIPVVSVPLPELAAHPGMVSVGETPEAYVAAVGKLVSAYPFTPAEASARALYARQHSWERRASEFLSCCDALEVQNPLPGTRAAS